jgi:hypothetical protein
VLIHEDRCEHASGHFPASPRVRKKAKGEGWRIGVKEAINIARLTCYATISET